LKLETRPHDSDAGVVFERMRDAFAQAWTANPNKRWDSLCSFGGGTARLRVAGHGLARQMAQAFAHLWVEGDISAADLVIDLWDERETAVACPWETQPVEDRILNTTSYVEFGLILGALNDRFVGSQRPGVITWLDRREGRLIGSVARHDQISLYDVGKPLHFPLLLWHQDRSNEVLHGALVSRNGEGVFLAGKGGSGKSTVALACLESGFDYVGDDYIALTESGEGRFAGHALYNATWLMADHLKKFPRFLEHALYPERRSEEKALVLLSQIFPERLLSRAPIRALVLPRITASPAVRVRPASRAEALFALAPSSILLRPNSGAATLEKLTRLVDAVPCWWLELDGDLAAIAGRVDEVLRSSRCASEPPLPVDCAD
jgi:hypothetical protein